MQISQRQSSSPGFTLGGRYLLMISCVRLRMNLPERTLSSSSLNSPSSISSWLAPGCLLLTMGTSYLRSRRLNKDWKEIRRWSHPGALVGGINDYTHPDLLTKLDKGPKMLGLTTPTRA